MKKPDKIDVQIVLPECSTDEVSEGLRALTQAIDMRGLGDASQGGLLGGEFGYGANFENATFMMHRFCWCEESSCFWCGKDCGCGKGYGRGHFLDGKPVTKKAYEKWHATIVKPLPWEAVGGHDKQYVSPPDWWSGKPPPAETEEYKAARDAFDNYIKERDSRSGRIFKAVIHTCGHGMFYDQKEDIWAVFAPRPYPHTAPQFWHKKSGSRVWWYKYIGRDMEISLGTKWDDVLRDCLESLLPRAPRPKRTTDG